jgi:two-component system chemotaxis sensor kinase CheA
MDAVRAAIRNMGGSVTLESRARQGTRVRFLLPFSVMMTRVMPVMAGSERFGVPLDAISETIRVRRSEIVPIGASHAVVLRNRTVLVISLHEALSLPAPAGSGDDVTLVVTRSERYEGALLVDSVGEPMTVMLKPLEGLLSNSYALAGSTLVGDGSVLLILDLGELFN